QAPVIDAKPLTLKPLIRCSAPTAPAGTQHSVVPGRTGPVAEAARSTWAGDAFKPPRSAFFTAAISPQSLCDGQGQCDCRRQPINGLTLTCAFQTSPKTARRNRRRTLSAATDRRCGTSGMEKRFGLPITPESGGP